MEIHDRYDRPDINETLKSCKLRWSGHLAAFVVGFFYEKNMSKLLYRRNESVGNRVTERK